MSPLFAMEFNLMSPWVFIMFGVGFVFVALFVRVSNRVEGFRERAMDLRDMARDLGLLWTADLLSCLAVGDTSGAIRHVIEGARAMGNEDSRWQVYTRVFKASTSALWKRSSTLRDVVREHIAELEAGTLAKETTSVVREKLVPESEVDKAREEG